MISWKMFLVRTFQTQFLSPKFSHMKRIAILTTAFFLMFAVTTPAFADDTGKKSCETATIADVNFEAVYLLDDLAPPILVAPCNEANTTVSQEDYRPEIACAATFTSKNKQDYICKKSTSKTAIATAGNITAANYVINRAAKNTPIIQANTPQVANNASMQYTSRPEGCECDIVVTIEISPEEVMLTATPDKQMPDVVPRK